jgi:hypothetical protein
MFPLGIGENSNKESPAFAAGLSRVLPTNSGEEP